MKTVNHSAVKVDGQRLVLGKPAYTADLADEHGLVVKVLRSPHAHAEIRAVDVRKARELPGVACVLTHEDLPRNPITRAGQTYPEPSPYDTFVLDRVVRYVGDAVAIVAAATVRAAEEALTLIEVDYGILEPVLEYEQALDHTVCIHREPEAHSKVEFGYKPDRNLVCHMEEQTGDVDKELLDCPVIHQGVYRTQGQAHGMMEPFAASASLDLQGRLVVVSSTQIPFHVRRTLGTAFGLPLSRIRVIKPRIGGGFGGKQTVAGEIYVAAVTLATGKPCKMIYTRRETFESTTCRHPMRMDITLGADEEGHIKAIDVDVLGNTGAYGEHAATVLLAGCFKGMPLYSRCAIRYRGAMVYTNQRPSGALRGYGVTQICFALESAMDELAARLEMDPVELRRINMIRKGDNYNPVGPPDQSKELLSCQLPACLELGAKAIGWDERTGRDPGAGTKVRGKGMALSMQGSGLPGIDLASATIKLNDDGFFNLMVGATDLGTGSDTILSQIAAEELGVALEQVVPYSSDTDLTPFDSGAYASSTTYLSGNAVRRAAARMKDMIEEEAAKLFMVEREQVVFDSAFVTSRIDGQTMDLKKLAQERLYMVEQKQLAVTESFVGKHSPPPFVAGFAEVEVDTQTGKIDLIHYAAAVDCGVPVNPNLCRIQVEGGSVQGIGMALFEQALFDTAGRLRNNSFLNYKIPCRTDLGKISVAFAQGNEPTGPFGAKSLGEVVINPPAPAILNAIFDATGIRFRSLPVTPEDMLMALLKQEQASL